ncbi:MAG: MBL fold metallo-hydrolase [Anaerolineales bacterium]
MVVPESKTPHTFEQYHTASGAVIYRLPLEGLPRFWVYAYLVRVDGMTVLIDTGTGWVNANQGLEDGLAQAGVQWGDLTHVLLTHGHIDHFGGLGYVRARAQAQVGIHELDVRNITHYEERIFVVDRRLERYLLEAGVPDERRAEMMRLYRLNKSMFTSQAVDFTYEAHGMRFGPFEFLHVPGHTAGHVIIRLHDVLFSGDHVLDGISPHQSPERLTLNTGLGHYLDSLNVLEAWGGQARLTFGGHNDPIADLPGRIRTLRQRHHERLAAILSAFEAPLTICEVADMLFPRVRGYDILLAIEETGAHVEYLYQRGLLRLANLPELESNPDAPLRYQRIEDAVVKLQLA